MAKRIVERLIDDIDGGDADETVRFGLDGVLYEIDLSTKHAHELREAVAPFVAAGSKVRTDLSPRGLSRGRAAAAGTAGLTSAVRAWAKSQGRQVPVRGRISQDLIDEYRAKIGR